MFSLQIRVVDAIADTVSISGVGVVEAPTISVSCNYWPLKHSWMLSAWCTSSDSGASLQLQDWQDEHQSYYVEVYRPTLAP